MRSPATPGGGPHNAADIARTYKAGHILGQRWGALILDTFFFLVLFVALGMTVENPNLPITLVAIFIPFYFVVLEGRWGVTLGKLGTKIRVVNMNGQAPGYLKALVRMLLRLIEVNPILFGGIPAAVIVWLSETRQRLGDMLAGTYVLYLADVRRLQS
jgi:uncharacterized RDD family membrane protein YckC